MVPIIFTSILYCYIAQAQRLHREGGAPVSDFAEEGAPSSKSATIITTWQNSEVSHFQIYMYFANLSQL